MRRTAWVSSTPFISGMARSVMIRSGVRSRRASNASSPFCATHHFVAIALQRGAQHARNLALVIDNKNVASSSRLLRDDVQIDVRRLGHELLDREIVQIFFQSMQRGAAEDRLRDSLLDDEGRGGGRDASCPSDGRSARPGSLQTADCASSVRLRSGVIIAVRGHVQDVQFAVQTPRPAARRAQSDRAPADWS